MAQAYCNNCKEIIPLICYIKKAVCECGSKDLITVRAEWNDKGGWDYYDRKGVFLKFEAITPFGFTEPEHIEQKHNKQIIKQLQLEL